MHVYVQHSIEAAQHRKSTSEAPYAQSNELQSKCASIRKQECSE